MPDTSTEVALATTTLSSAASTITFSSIAASYTDLRLVITGTLSAGNGVRVQFNSDTATNYSYTELLGNGTSAASDRANNQTYIDLAQGWYWNSTQPNFTTLDIFSYAGSTFKTALITTSIDWNGSGAVIREVGLWRSTAAISTITFSTSGGDFAAGTTATIYGIL